MSRFRPKLGVGAISAVSVAAGAGVAVFAPSGAALISASTAALALGAAGLAAGGAGIWLGWQARQQARDTRAAFRIVTAKITRLESEIGRVEQQAAEQQAPATLKNSLAEITAEIGLLGGLMRDIAETVAVHDRALDDISQRLTRQPQAATAAAAPTVKPPVPPAPRTFTPPPVAVATPAMPAAPPAFAAPAVPWPQAEPRPAPRPAPTTANAPPPRDDPRADLIAQAALDDRAELHLQPIVDLPQRRVRLYEVLSRLRLGPDEVLPPAAFLPIVERRGLAAAFDERTFRRALIVARHLAGRGSEALVACNLSAAAIATPGFLRSLARAAADHTDVAQRMVLEIPQQVMRQFDAERLGALAEITALGIGLTIDHVVDFRFDPPSLADRGVRHIKIPAGLLLGAEAQRANIAIGDLAALLNRAGIMLIAEHVESEEVVRDILDLDVPLAQGFVFAVPRPVRPEVFDAQPVPEPAPQSEETAAPPPERKPFRAFLRRAATA